MMLKKKPFKIDVYLNVADVHRWAVLNKTEYITTDLHPYPPRHHIPMKSVFKMYLFINCKLKNFEPFHLSPTRDYSVSLNMNLAYTQIRHENKLRLHSFRNVK